MLAASGFIKQVAILVVYPRASANAIMVRKKEYPKALILLRLILQNPPYWPVSPHPRYWYHIAAYQHRQLPKWASISSRR